MTRRKNKLPRHVRNAIASAAFKADMKLARCGVSKDAKEAMRLYLDTWVVDVLNEVLRWDRGEITAADLDYCS